MIDPQKGISAAERRRAFVMVNGNPDRRREAEAREDVRLAPRGSGSDYTPFLQHLGIASLNIGYGGENPGGSYQSIYDSFDHYIRFRDPNFDYGVTLAPTTGRTVLRLENAEILPFEFQRLHDNIRSYVSEIMKLTDNMRDEMERESRLIREGRSDAVFDPTQTFVTPQPKKPVPHLNFASLLNATERLEEAAAHYGRTLAAFEQSNSSVPTELRQVLDQRLFQTKRYKHQIYAPGFYTGYGVKTLPGIREAIEERNWQEAEEQIEIVSTTLRSLADQTGRAPSNHLEHQEGGR